MAAPRTSQWLVSHAIATRRWQTARQRGMVLMIRKAALAVFVITIALLLVSSSAFPGPGTTTAAEVD